MMTILNGQILVFLSRDARSWKYSIFSNCRSCGVFCVAIGIYQMHSGYMVYIALSTQGFSLVASVQYTPYNPLL